MVDCGYLTVIFALLIICSEIEMIELEDPPSSKSAALISTFLD